MCSKYETHVARDSNRLDQRWQAFTSAPMLLCLTSALQMRTRDCIKRPPPFLTPAAARMP